MVDLVQALTETEWTGRADLFLPEDHCNARKIPVFWTPRELAFEFRFAPDSALLKLLMEVEWRRSPYVPILLRNVVLEQGPWTLSADELKVSRINPLREWPDDWWSDDAVSEQRLQLRPVGSQHIDFHLMSPGTSPAYGALLQNWPQSMWLPPVVERPGHAPILLSAGANGMFLSSDEPPASGWDRVSTALQLACGAPLPRTFTMSPGRCTLYRTVATPPPSELPMFKDGGVCRVPIHDMLCTLLQMPHEELEVLRFAAAITVQGKSPELFLEMRYLLLMMCVEMLDGQRQLSGEATARMLGVDRPVAEFLNGMRNQLVHAHSGGGYRNAFAAWVRENRGVLPAMPAAWAHTIDAEAGELRFDRLYFQLCERVDAFWCRRLGVRDARRCRRVFPYSTLGGLPPAPAPAPSKDAPPVTDGREQYIAQLEAALRSKKSEITRLKGVFIHQGRVLAEERGNTKALQDALKRNGIEVPDAPHAADP